MKILHINACVRDDSRTNVLTKYLLNKLEGDIEEVNLNQIGILPLTKENLIQRDKFINQQDYSSSMFDYAKQFSNADIIIVSTPYWDLSFPALLKIYIENINVPGITFVYTDKGIPKSLCKAKKMYYITTSGGPIISDEFGFGYVKSLTKTFYEISDIEYIKAQGLDIYGADVQGILNTAKMQIDKLI